MYICVDVYCSQGMYSTNHNACKSCQNFSMRDLLMYVGIAQTNIWMTKVGCCVSSCTQCTMALWSVNSVFETSHCRLLSPLQSPSPSGPCNARKGEALLHVPLPDYTLPLPLPLPFRGNTDAYTLYMSLHVVVYLALSLRMSLHVPQSVKDLGWAQV